MIMSFFHECLLVSMLHVVAGAVGPPFLCLVGARVLGTDHPAVVPLVQEALEADLFLLGIPQLEPVDASSSSIEPLVEEVDGGAS